MGCNITATRVGKNWKTENIDGMVKIFQEQTTNELDKIAPVKSFKIKQSYKFGLSDDTKSKIKERNQLSKNQNKQGLSDRVISIKKYKTLRNKINAQFKPKFSRFFLMVYF